MQCFAIPFKPLGPKMAKTVSCSNTTERNPPALHPSSGTIIRDAAEFEARGGGFL